MFRHLPSGGLPGRPWRRPVAAVVVTAAVAILVAGAWSGSAVAAPALDGSTIEESALDGSATDGTVLNGATIDESTIDESTIDEATIGGSTIDGAAADGNVTAAFEWSPATPDPGERVWFDATASSDDVVEYRWDFDDDGDADYITDDPTGASYFFGTRGERTVTLTVFDANGRSDATSERIHVASGEGTTVARCSVSPGEARVGEAVTVDASDSENATSADVDLDGDGEYERSADDLVVEATYDRVGSYSVRVRARGIGPETDVTSCGTVSVVPNQSPEAAFGVTPDSPAPGEAVTLDAGESTDPENRIVEYRWDLDGDGETDATTADPTVEHSFEEAGTYAVTLTVVDDLGATDSVERSVGVEPRRDPPVARCSLDAESVLVGEEAVVNATGTENADRVRVDADGDGEFDRTLRTEVRVTHVYDRAGEYAPSIVAEGEGTDAAECGTVAVSDAADPGTPADDRTADPSSGAVSTGERTTTDAAGSGSLALPVDARWVLLAGVVLAIGVFALGVRTRPDEGDPGERSTGGEFTEGPFAAAPLANGGVGGTDHAVGSFETPPGGGTVAVQGLPARPDLVFLTAVEGEDPNSGEGSGSWSHGVVHHTWTEVTQRVARVGDTDAGSADAGVRDDAVIDLPVGSDGDGTAWIRGRFDGTTPDGFEVTVEAPDDATATVRYHALAFAADATRWVEVGTVPLSGDHEQSVDFGITADHVSLVAVSSGGESASLSHGVVSASDGDRKERDERAGDDGESEDDGPGESEFLQNTIVGGMNADSGGDDEGEDNEGSGSGERSVPDQAAVGSAVDSMGGGAYVADDSRALSLPGIGEGTGTTAVRATRLGATLDLTYDSLVPDAGATAIYVAVDAGAGPAPTSGLVEVPEDDRCRVETDYPPAVLGLAANGGALGPDSRRIAGGLPDLGWSHGLAITGGDAPVADFLPASPGGAGLEPNHGLRVPTVTAEGRLDGHTTLAVEFDDGGFSLDALDDEGSPLPVLYTAWPGE